MSAHTSRRGQCRTVYSKDGGNTWFLNTQCTLRARIVAWVW